MKTRIICCVLALILCIPAFHFYSLAVDVLPVHFTVSLECNDQIPLNGIVIEISISNMNFSESSSDTTKFDNTYLFSVETDQNGNARFDRPSNYFLLSVVSESLPDGYEINPASVLVFPDTDSYMLKLSAISNNITRESGSTLANKYYAVDGNVSIADAANDEPIIISTAQNDSKNHCVKSNALCGGCHRISESSLQQLLCNTRTLQSTISPQYKFRVFYRDDVTTLAVAQAVAAAFDTIDTYFCTTNGFTHPTGIDEYSTYYDVILGATTGSLAQTEYYNYMTPNNPVMVYRSVITVNVSFAEQIEDDPSGNQEEWGVLAHEYMHAIMNQYDIEELSWMQESFASWAGIIYKPSIFNIAGITVSSLMGDEIDQYLLSMDENITNTTELKRVYGTCLFPIYIYENLGGFTTIKNIFSACSSYPNPLGDNYASTYLQAIKYVINGLSNTPDYFGQHFAQFMAYNNNPKFYYSILQNVNYDFAAIDLEDSHTTYPCSFSSITTDNPLSCRFYSFQPPDLSLSTLQITVNKGADVGDASLHLSTVLENPSGTQTIYCYTTDSDYSSTTILINNFSTNNICNVLFVTINSGASSNSDYTYSASLLCQPAKNMRYAFRNKASGKCLTVYNGLNVDQTNVIQYTATNDSKQYFYLRNASNVMYPNAYKLKPQCSSAGNGKCVDVNRSGTTASSGDNAWLSLNSSNVVQYWYVQSVGNGYFKVVLYENTQLALTAYGTSNGTANGTTPTSAGNVFVSTFVSGNDYQLWELVPTA